MFESFLHNSRYSIIKWLRNLFKHKDDSPTITHNYTTLMEESVKLGEESYAFIDKNPPHLVLETTLENNTTLETTLETLESFVNSHPNFDLLHKQSQSTEQPPKSMKQRFQQQQYHAFMTDDSIDTPSKNTRQQKRRNLKPIFRDCLTHKAPKPYNNTTKLPISYKNALTTPSFKTFNNSKKGGEQNRN